MTLCLDRTCTEKDHLIVEWQLREVGNSLGPLHQRVQLFVSGLADVGDCIMGLWANNKSSIQAKPLRK